MRVERSFADPLAFKVEVFNEADDGGLCGDGVIDVISSRPWRNDQQREAWAGCAASLCVPGCGIHAGQGGCAVSALPGTVESVALGGGSVGDVGHDVVVPTVGVVIGDDDGSMVPVGLLLKEVDDADDPVLLVERIGVAGMAVLKSR